MKKDIELIVSIENTNSFITVKLSNKKLELFVVPEDHKIVYAGEIKFFKHLTRKTIDTNDEAQFYKKLKEIIRDYQEKQRGKRDYAQVDFNFIPGSDEHNIYLSSSKKRAKAKK